MTKKQKVFVGLSGGVDSAVAAALLQRAGYAVTGVFIRAWDPSETMDVKCGWREERRDAMRVAARLQIPFVTLDLSQEYKKLVVDEMVAGYRAGQTPNPDILCNREIKFGLFYQWAIKHGADFIATGHYVRASLRVAKDKNKDQSYWLWTLTPEILKHCLFPIGEYTKPTVRRLAKKFGLPVAMKKDSQGLCFIGKIDVKDFLRGELGEGAHLYTIGEKVGGQFVIDKKERLITAPSIDTSPYARRVVKLKETNWFTPSVVEGLVYSARTRYRAPLSKCRVNGNEVTFLGKPPLSVPGQSLVVYDGEQLIGGGVISDFVLKSS